MHKPYLHRASITRGPHVIQKSTPGFVFRTAHLNRIRATSKHRYGGVSPGVPGAKTTSVFLDWIQTGCLGVGCVMIGWVLTLTNYDSGQELWPGEGPDVRSRRDFCPVVKKERLGCGEVRKSFQHWGGERVRRWDQAERWIVAGVWEHRDWTGGQVWIMIWCSQATVPLVCFTGQHQCFWTWSGPLRATGAKTEGQ